MQINLLSISLWIIKRLSTFVCAYLPKQNQKGRECGHLLAGWRSELTLLSSHKEAFMEAAHCMEWVYSLLTDQHCGTPTTCYRCLSQTGTIYPNERPTKQTTKSMAMTHSHLVLSDRQDSRRYWSWEAIMKGKKHLYPPLTVPVFGRGVFPRAFHLILGQTVVEEMGCFSQNTMNS